MNIIIILWFSGSNWFKVPRMNNKICRFQIIGDNGNKYSWLFQKSFGNFTTIFFLQIFKVAGIMKSAGWANCLRQWQVEGKEGEWPIFSPVSKNILTTKICKREGSGSQIGWIFRKSAKGGEVIFDPKIYIADFGNLNRAFWSWNWYKIVISEFRYVFKALVVISV